MQKQFLMSCLLLAGTVGVSVMTGCGGGSATTVGASVAADTGSQAQAISVAKSSQTRNLAPQVSDADMTAAVAGNTSFGLQMLPLLDPQGDSNLVFSPYSISQALAMTAAGAQGDTLTGIQKALAFQLDPNRLLPAFNKLDLALAGKTISAGSSNTKLPSLNIANALWAQQGYKLQTTYLDAIGSNFGAAVNLLDFILSPEAARTNINTWVENQTQQRIKNLLPAGSVSPSTRLVLTNAIWFKSEWAVQFISGRTVSQNFYDIRNQASSQAFMNQDLRVAYAQGKNYQALELPYVDNKLAMLLIKPDAGSFDTFRQSLSVASLAELTGSLKDQRISLSMPKFSFSSSPQMTENLKSLGMSAAFDPARADFSGMTGTRELSVSSVVHKAFINVDENGTEAAAATGVVVGITSISTDPLVKVVLDRPFLFFIRDRETGLILFMGKVMVPGAV
ncbi:serpin family protein [Undibacterium sp. TJN19]|uniref:serpin family protein n=1 Tax=Undibacterium sp. TJN19 TaxID=3413055 RepID=UPI003BF2F755